MADSLVVARDERSAVLSRLRLLTTLAVLYVSQAIPAFLFMTAALAILREEGASRSEIGLVGLVLLPGLLRFLWAPWVDRLRPFAGSHRAGWIGLSQAGIVMGLVALSFIEPVNIGPFLAIGLVIAVLLATNDIAVDGYATKNLKPADRPLGNAIQSGAVALGVIIGGSGALVLYHYAGWQITVLAIAAMALAPIVAAFAMREGELDAMGQAARPAPGRASIIAFFRRPEARRIFWVALIYRASEGLIATMKGPYLVDKNIGLDTIGYLTGAGAAAAGLAGSGIAALLLLRIGASATLFILGLFRTACVATLALHAFSVVPGLGFVFAAISVQSLVIYMEIVVLFSLSMMVASRQQPGTDFTILSCAQTAAFLIGTMLSGILADRLGYGAFFALAAGISLLSTLATLWLLRRLSPKTAG